MRFHKKLLVLHGIYHNKKERQKSNTTITNQLVKMSKILNWDMKSYNAPNNEVGQLKVNYIIIFNVLNVEFEDQDLRSITNTVVLLSHQ